MLDGSAPAVLRGFDVAAADVGDRLRFCQPVLSFDGDPALYVARRLDWQNDRKALAVTDPAEAAELGTLLPDTGRPISSGKGVVAAGTGFVDAAAVAGVHLDRAGMSFLSLADAKCRIAVATPECFAKLKARLADEALTVFDVALGEAARHGRRLCDRGNAALLLLRRCGPRRRDDLAIRQLAGARQNRELDLYRRLLIRFELELKTQKEDLHKEVERHIEGVVTVVSQVMREMAGTLGIEAQRGCIGAVFEDNLKRAEDAVGEIRRLHTEMREADAPDDGG